MTTIDEFYKVGPGPSSSHTIGPMRITYDFYQRCTKRRRTSSRRPRAQGAPVRQPERHRKGHGTERAALAASLARSRRRSTRCSSTDCATSRTRCFRQARDKTFNASLADIVYDAPRATSRTPTR